MITAKKDKFIIFITGVVMISACAISTIFLLSVNSVKIIALASLMELLLFIIFNTSINGSPFNFANLFFMVAYIFNFGQITVVAFFEETASHMTIYLRYFSDKENFYAFRYINLAYAAMCIGALAAQMIIMKKDRVVLFRKWDSFALKIRAKTILLLTFPIKLVIDIRTMLIGLRVNSSAANMWQNSIPDIVVTYGNISIIGMALMLVALKDDKKKQNWWLILLLVYTCIIMLGGKRSENVSYICIYLLLYLKTSNSRITLKKVILISIIAYILLAILSTIVYARTYVKVRDFDNMLNTFRHCLLEQNVILVTLRDYGTTGYTAECVLLKWLEKYPPSYGLSYVGGLSSVLPNIGDVFGKINRSTGFAFLLQKYNTLDSRYFNIGGSVIGEAFFNFGIYGGIIVTMFIGTLIGTVSKKVSNYIVNGIDYRVTYYIAVMSALLYWVRDYFGGISREIIWSVIACWFIERTIIKRTEGGGK